MDGSEPHDHIVLAGCSVVASRVVMPGGGGVPGYGMAGVGREGYTGYSPSTVPGPIFNIFQAISPTYGQMKAILTYLMRFLR